MPQSDVEKINALLATPELPELGPGPRNGIWEAARLNRSLDETFHETNLPDENQQLIRALVLARTADGTAPLPLRTHYFFHNAGRIWACVNAACPARTGVTPPGRQPPPVGVLFSEPGPRCPSCNSRILELLYCQPCGEVFLGGYKKPDQQSPNAWYLSPDYPNLEGVPDKSA